MIVVDASALLDALLPVRGAEEVQQRLLMSIHALHAPHLIDVEIVQALRRLVRMDLVTADVADAVVHDLLALPLHRHRHDALLPQIWALRHNLTAYDATYVALAGALDAPLLTRDRRMAAAAEAVAKVELVDSGPIS